MSALRIGLLVFLAALATSCDSFSVVDQYQIPTSGTKAPVLTLALQTPNLAQNATTLIVASGGTPPYTYAVLAAGSASPGSLGSTSIDPAQFTAGTSVGTFRVRVIDSLGDTADAAAAVLPPTPTGFSLVYTGSPPKNTLSWSYGNLDYVTGFRLESSSDSGSTYQEVVALGKSESTYVHQGGGVQGRFYRLYAVFDVVSSLPAEVQ